MNDWEKHFRAISQRAIRQRAQKAKAARMEKDGATFGGPLDALMSGIAGLKNSVIQGFVDFTTPLEVYTPYMYTDSKGYVTTGIGNLIENLTTHLPADITFQLPWKKPDGSLASHDEVDSAWHTVKAAWPRVQSTASASLTNLRLTKDDVTKLVASKLAANHTYLLGLYPNYVSWPADAQLALHSMAWAMGPGFHFPAFSAAVNASPPDFLTAADQSHIRDGAPQRNAANRQMFLNADAVLKKKADPNKLWWPSTSIVTTVVGAGMSVLAFGIFGLMLFLGFRKKSPSLPGRSMP